MADLIVDSFAGGGGASTGIEAALGRPVDIAINHSPAAIAMHRANHPRTLHLCENVWQVDPLAACGGRPVGFAHFSPDCTFFSRAKGGKPLDKKVRALAWTVIRWGRTVWPRVILLENVPEFLDWGPLNREGRPDPSRKGRTFRVWLGKLRALGYQVDHRLLVAADYGTPTTRRRLFLVARCDGEPIAWPEPTHGKGRQRPWRTAAEIIDWSLPCPSIFDRARPLAEATLQRIAAGVRRYVLESARPFVVKYHGGREWRGQSVAEPLHTVDTANHYALVAPTLVSHYGNSVGRSVCEPAPTVTAGGQGHTALVAALITKHYGNGVVGHGVERPLGAVTAIDHHAVTAAFLTKFYGTSTGSDVREPLPTVTAECDRGGGHLAEVRAFLVKYYGAEQSQQQSLFDPLHTVTTKARFGLVTVAGEAYQIADIGMRMLAPHELFAAQGFPPEYVIAPLFEGRPLTKTAQIALAGNSVCPQVEEAIVRANLRERIAEVA